MPLESGTVQAIGATDKGTPKLQIGGKWYYAGRGVDVSEVTAGREVTLEYTLFGDNKNVRGIKNWSFNPAMGNPQGNPIPPANLPQTPGIGGPAPNTMTEGERAFVSNVCAHAIDGGLIKAHTDLSTWVKAALDALRHFDDKIPF